MPTNASTTIAFGPVPSRRLGRSLGINNIPPKFCSYSCLYCQVGRTPHKEIGLRPFYEPDEIFEAVSEKVNSAKDVGEKIDYLTFVPDGEPTLDARLGETIDLLRSFNINIAIISNASLLWRKDVQATLNKADVVSVKVDSTDKHLWKMINQPHESLELMPVLHGIESFAKQYKGQLLTETMLLAGINDGFEAVSGVANFLERIKLGTAYVAVPTRPPAESGISPPSEEATVQAYNILNDRLEHVEYLIGYEGNAFANTGDLEQDLLSITAVHPMREEAVNEMLLNAGMDWGFIQTLLESHKLKKVAFSGKTFYMRPLTATKNREAT
jgi:wyosine [tRNA(Phe)-imidazoG37] synthetase (radical SAM superfamily)